MSAVAGAAYRSAEKIYNKYDGIMRDFSRKQGVVHSEIILPTNAPKEYADRSTLWNAIETTLKRKDAQLAREFNIGLQQEFSFEENLDIMRSYIKENFVDKGMCADFAIHDNNDGNPHAHIMLTKNEVSAEGIGRVNKEWDDKELFEQWRGNWAEICNEKFKEKRLDLRIDHRTLKAQGIEREPTIHIGATVHAMKKKGIETDRWRENNEIIKRNKQKTQSPTSITAKEKHKKDKNINKKQYKNPDITQHQIRHPLSRANDIERIVVDINNAQKPLDKAIKQRINAKMWQSKIKKNAEDIILGEQDYIDVSRKKLKQQYGIKQEDAPAEIKRLRSGKPEIQIGKSGIIADVIKTVVDEAFEDKEQEKSRLSNAEIRKEIRRLEALAKEIDERTFQVHNQYGRDFFKKQFGVEIEQADEEIGRIKAKEKELEEELQNRAIPEPIHTPTRKLLDDFRKERLQYEREHKRKRNIDRTRGGHNRER